jgi:hypothetical protein
MNQQRRRQGLEIAVVGTVVIVLYAIFLFGRRPGVASDDFADPRESIDVYDDEIRGPSPYDLQAAVARVVEPVTEDPPVTSEDVPPEEPAFSAVPARPRPLSDFSFAVVWNDPVRLRQHFATSYMNCGGRDCHGEDHPDGCEDECTYICGHELAALLAWDAHPELYHLHGALMGIVLNEPGGLTWGSQQAYDDLRASIEVIIKGE